MSILFAPEQLTKSVGPCFLNKYTRMALPENLAQARFEQIRHDLLAYLVPLLNRALRARGALVFAFALPWATGALCPYIEKDSHIIVVLGVPMEPTSRIGLALQARIDRAIKEAQTDPGAFIVVTGAAVQNRWMEALP